MRCCPLPEWKRGRIGEKKAAVSGAQEWKRVEGKVALCRAQEGSSW